MRTLPLPLLRSLAAFSTLALPLPAAIVTWDAGAGTNAWSTPNNWDPNAEPAAGDDVIFPAGLAGTIILSSGENAKSLTFNDTYTLNNSGASAMTLTLAAGSSITVADGHTATITTGITATGGTAKLGPGRLLLNATNTFSGNLVINEGTVRPAVDASLGVTTNAVNINSGGTLEIAPGQTMNRPIALNDGGTLKAAGTSISNGTTTVAAASTVTLGTVNAADSLTIGNAANEFTGGAGSKVVIAGPGAVRMSANSNYAGKYTVSAGSRLDIGTVSALGATPSEGVTLDGGTLAGRSSATMTFTGSQGNTLDLTASSSLLSDRASNGGGLTYTFGTLSMGTHTLSAAPGVNVTSGTAGITLGNITLSGNPTFAVNETAAGMKLSLGSLNGGGVARTISKTGPGDFTVTGGATSLAAGSTFSGADGGTYEFITPLSGTDPVLTATTAQNPLGEASASITGGTLRLLSNGNGGPGAQTLQLGTAFTLGGTVTLDPDRISAGSNKTWELPGLTLAAGTDLTMLGANTNSIRLTSPLTLQGDATLRGGTLTLRTGLITAQAGITGGAVSDTLILAGGTSPLNLVLNAPGSFPGSTVISGALVTANAAPAFGTGTVSMSSGSLTVNADAALQGTVNVSGGTLRVNDNDALALNPLNLSGGTLDLRSNASATFATGTLTLSGDATLNVANNGSGTVQTITLPTLNVTGSPVLTVTNANSFTPLLPSIQLAGDLTIATGLNSVRTTGITEDGSPRKLLKAGTGTLDLEAAGTYSGGTEILAGTLSVEHASALGSGDVTLGDSGGTANVTLRLAAGLTVNNDVTVRAGSSGAATISTPSPSNTVMAGDITLQRPVTFDGAGTNPFTFSGRITGPFDVTRSGSGTIVLANSLNDFGTGGPGSLTIGSGIISVGSDSPLGLGGITLNGSGSTLRITDTFATSRLITHGLNARFEVDLDKVFTLNTAMASDVLFDKLGSGTMAFAPSVVSTRTTGADVVAGRLRMTGAHGLSTGGVISMSNSTVLELLNDTDTVYPQSIASAASGSFTIHTDRAEGGSASNGTHTTGPISLTTGALTHTGANGFALTTGALSTTGSASVMNDGTGLLTIPSLALGGTSTTARTLTVETNAGDIRVPGTVTQTGTPIYNLTKRGPLTLRLESGLGFTGAVSVSGGTLDLNNTSNTIGGLLTLGGESPASAVLLQSGTGTLTLGGNVTASTGFNPPTMTIAGAALDLGGADRTFTVGLSSAAGADLEIPSPITGSAGILKTGSGVLRFSGAGANSYTGLTTITDGTLELAKTGANAIGAGGLEISGTSAPAVTLSAAEQIADTAPVTVDAVSTSALLNLAGFTETTGAVTVSSTSSSGASITTGASGVLVLNGDLTLANNRDSSAANEREVLITGTGTEFVTSSTGTLDLGGVNRVITVSTDVVSANADNCHATIETQIINGGIVKRGTQTLFVTNPGNTFAGGVRIEEGCVDFGDAGSPGSGGITLAPGAGSTACFALSAPSGSSALPITLDGDASGLAKIVYGGAIGESYTFTSPLALTAQGVCVEVTNGTNAQDTAATLNLTGAISGPNALTKTGSGILTLQPGNTHTGTTVQRGVLKISADSALGLSAGALTVSGGCFHADGTFALTRPFVFGPNGGCIRVDRPDDELPKNALTIPALTWSDAAQSFFSSGQAILSGTTTAGNGPLTIGAQTVFADATASTVSFSNFVLSQRGTAALPAGNLSLVNRGVLELGNGDFTRALGVGAGEVQAPTATGAGFAAHGADRIVNLGGASAQIVWGSHDPAGPFLGVTGSTSGSAGWLVLGSETATHTVDFQNPLEVRNNTTSTFFIRTIQVPDGPATVEARVSGDITLTHPDPAANYSISFEVNGALEVTGDILGNADLFQYAPGTTIISGSNPELGYVEIGGGGTLSFTSNAAIGTPYGIWIEQGAELNVSGLTTPLIQGADEYCEVSGTFHGSITSGGYLSGDGTITGNVVMNASTSSFGGIEPWGGATPLSIGGDFTLNAGAVYWAWADGPVANAEYSQIAVTGNVTLAGTLDIEFQPIVPPAEGDTYFILLNAGSDAVSGTFAGLPEGSTVTMANGQTGTITYTANGDGGPVGNDVAIIAGPVPPPPVEGEIPLTGVTFNAATCTLSGTMQTEDGVDYIVEKSEDLVTWTTVETFTGDGTPRLITGTLNGPDREFLRVRKDPGIAAE